MIMIKMNYMKSQLLLLKTPFFENDDIFDLMPLGNDDTISFVDRYGDNINKILQGNEADEDVDEVEIERCWTKLITLV